MHDRIRVIVKVEVSRVKMIVRVMVEFSRVQGPGIKIKQSPGKGGESNV